MSLDLSRFDTATMANSGAPVPLKFNGQIIYADAKDGEPQKPVVFYLIGRDSDQFRGELRDTRRKAKAMAAAGNKPKVKTEEQEELEDRQRCASYIKGWSNNFSVDGKDFPYSQENAIALICDKRFQWLYEFVNAEVMNRENFLPG